MARLQPDISTLPSRAPALQRSIEGGCALVLCIHITEAWGGLFDASSFGGWGAAGGGGEAGGGAEGGGAAEGAPFHFYVAAPARTDPSVVERAADDAVMALVPVPPIDERLSAEAQAEACAAAVARARCVAPPTAALALPAL